MGALRRGWARARRREAPSTSVLDVDRRGAFLVGLLHGTGAETPTQIALFAAAGASGSTATAAVVLGSFVAGLVAADLGIAAAWVSGLLGARRAPRVQIALGLATGVASLALGSLILTGHGGIVPPLAEAGPCGAARPGRAGVGSARPAGASRRAERAAGPAVDRSHLIRLVPA